MDQGAAAKRALYALARRLVMNMRVRPCGLSPALLSFAPSLKTTADSSSYGSFIELCLNGTMQKEVDEHRKTLHNLASLLLTNKTIRRTQQGSTEYDL
jgi:hypothetical protein